MLRSFQFCTAGSHELYILYVCIWASQLTLVANDAPANAGDAGDTDLTPWLGRPTVVESGKLLQYSCLENPMDGGAW